MGVTRAQIKCATLQIESRSCCDAALPRGSMTTVEYCPLWFSAEFDIQPFPPIADGKDFTALFARVKCAQIKCAALQIHKRSCCDAAFPRGQWNYSVILSSVRFSRIRSPAVATVAKDARDNCM